MTTCYQAIGMYILKVTAQIIWRRLEKKFILVFKKTRLSKSYKKHLKLEKDKNSPMWM